MEWTSLYLMFLSKIFYFISFTMITEQDRAHFLILSSLFSTVSVPKRLSNDWYNKWTTTSKGNFLNPPFEKERCDQHSIICMTNCQPNRFYLLIFIGRHRSQILSKWFIWINAERSPPTCSLCFLQNRTWVNFCILKVFSGPLILKDRNISSQIEK